MRRGAANGVLQRAGRKPLREALPAVAWKSEVLTADGS